MSAAAEVEGGQTRGGEGDKIGVLLEVVRQLFRRFLENTLATRITRSGSDENIALDAVVTKKENLPLRYSLWGGFEMICAGSH